MWNKRNILVLLSLLILILAVTKVTSSNGYVGFIVQGHLEWGENTSTPYIIEIDQTIDKANYVNNEPRLGFVLQKANPDAYLGLTIELVEGLDSLNIPMTSKDGYEFTTFGSIIVEPGSKYKLTVKTLSGSSDYTLKLFYPDKSYGTCDNNTSNVLDNSLLFYRVSQYAGTSSIHYLLDSGSTEEATIPGLYLFLGTEENFIVEEGFNQAVQLKELESSNFIVVEKNVEQSFCNYFLAAENATLEPLDISNNFTAPVEIRKNEQHLYNDVRLLPESKYILLVTTEESRADIKAYIYGADNYLLKESKRLWKNFSIINLDGLDLEKQYKIVIQGLAFDEGKFSSSYRLSQFGTSEFQTIALKPAVIMDCEAQIKKDDGLQIRWYVFRADSIGSNTIHISWKTPSVENTGGYSNNAEDGTRVILFEEGKPINSSFSVLDEDAVSFNVVTNSFQTTYMVKVVTKNNAFYTITTEGMRPVSIDIPTEYTGNITSNEVIFAMLVEMYSSGELGWEQFYTWHQRMYQVFFDEVKYKLFNIVVQKYKEDLITLSALTTYFSTLMTGDLNQPFQISNFLINLHAAGGINKEEFLRYYKGIVRMTAFWQAKIEYALLTKYSKGTISLLDFQSSFANYQKFYPLSVASVKEFLQKLLGTEDIIWEDCWDYKLVEDFKTEELNSLAVTSLKEDKVTLTDFKDAVTNNNVPDWYVTLCETGINYKDIKERVNAVDEIKSIQKALQGLTFYLSNYQCEDEVDGDLGPATKWGISNFKQYCNDYFSTEFSTTEDLDYDFLKYLIIAYGNDFLATRKVTMVHNSWYNDLQQWANELGDSIYSFTVDVSKHEERIRNLQIALANLGEGYDTFEWYGTRNDKTKEAIEKFKTDYLNVDKKDLNTDIDAKFLTKLLEKVYEPALIEDKYLSLTDEILGEVTWPTDLRELSSVFGYRYTGSGGRKFHNGIDIPVKLVDVKAVNSGTAVFAQVFSSYGSMIDIYHGKKDGKGVISRYAHLNNITVKADQDCSIEDVIGQSGNSGKATYPYHLHFKLFIHRFTEDKGIQNGRENVLIRLNPEEFLHGGIDNISYPKGR